MATEHPIKLIIDKLRDYPFGWRCEPHNDGGWHATRTERSYEMQAHWDEHAPDDH